MPARTRLLAWAPLIALAILLEFTGTVLAYYASFDNLVAELQDNGQQRLDRYANSLKREIGKYAYLPQAVGLDENVRSYLDHPKDPRLAGRVNRYLQQMSLDAGTMDIYLIDTGGRVIATSNWNQPDSFLGRNLSYRSYVRQASPGHVEQFYGIGTTHNDPGYYLSSALEDGHRTLGIVAVKVSLDQLEKSWLSAESPAILSDDNGVIILSSVPSWKYATLRPMSALQLQHLDETQQYNRRPLTPLGMSVRKVINADSHIVVLRGTAANGAGSPSGLYLAQSVSMSGQPWQLTVFYDLRKTNDLAKTRAALASAGIALLLAALGLLILRHRSQRDRRESRAALQRAYAELERKVVERTQALSEANTHLQHEIRERTEAARTLKEAQDELIQAGKLAVIGQMAASIAHELNQPLAALGTLSANAEEFLGRGDIDTARFNLSRIALLVQRMGKLTGQLRSFARRSSDETEAVDVAQAVSNAVGLFDQRMHKARVALDIAPPPQAAFAYGNAVQLEQVLVNLIANAIDATQQCQPPRIRIDWQRIENQVEIRVTDNGPGITDKVKDKLFDPFFTTKAKTGGLGLGLTISAGIIREFGGELTAGNRPEGGAEFTVTLQQATPEPDLSESEKEHRG